MSDQSDDLKQKFEDEDNESSFSNEKKIKENASTENSQKKFQEDKKNEKEKGETKETDEKKTENDKPKETPKDDKNVIEEKSNNDSIEKKDNIDIKKEEKKNPKSSSDSDSSSSENKSKNKPKKNKKNDKKVDDNSKEENLESNDEINNKKEKDEENEREDTKELNNKREEKEEKQEEETNKGENTEEEEDRRNRQEERKKRKRKDEEENWRKSDEKEGRYRNKNNRGRPNNQNNFSNYNKSNYRENNFHNDDNDKNNSGYYKRKHAKKFDLNEEKALNRIVSENIEIITEMKTAYPGFTQIECASVFRKIIAGNSQTIFEIMNQIHREITNQITLNEFDNKKRRNHLIHIDPFEIIDYYYNNPNHVKVMKYYKIYSEKDKEKLPSYVRDILDSEFYYTDESERRRKVKKYPDGGFNYIPIMCQNKNCNDKNCPYSHNENEMYYHPLFYKTKYNSYKKDGLLEKNATNLFDDFRVIYNYKKDNIINLIRLLDSKKIAKLSFKDIFRNQINSFQLETFKTLECPFIKSGMNCKKDPHLCYFYHSLSERRRPPTLFRYTNEMCPDQTYKENGKIKSHCKNGDFCNKCHSRYEYFYHKLFFGKAMTCLRPKKNGKCIFEETCYAYHPYKEPGYKKTKEEIIEEKKEELLEKYKDESELLTGLINNYKCQFCQKYNKKFNFYFLVKCEHILCYKCFKEKAEKKCPICKKKYNAQKEKIDYILIDIKKSANNIDELIKKNYEETQKKIEKKEKTKGNEEKNEKSNEEKKDKEN